VKRIATITDVRAHLAAARAGGARIALVPTMGALHEGHLQLVDAARAAAELVVLSVFVNPLQFGPGEDFGRYPRDVERDAALAAARGVDVLFTPSGEEMYPDGASGVLIAAPGLRDRLCGAFRPGHFDGVLTVVAKLFNIVAPDVAVFGQKDFQQAVLIRRMVRDLDFPVVVDLAPIVREADGLAMSSRNAYLAANERRRAAALIRGLRAAHAAFAAGERNTDALRRAARAVIDAEGGIAVQYLEVADPATLESVPRAEAGSVVAVAAHVGATRLIDNIILE
jgi:pantoate--beta-alanine ligase